jgi:hypothetical protein
MLKISGDIPLLPNTPLSRDQKQVLGLRIFQKRVCICIPELGSKRLQKFEKKRSFLMCTCILGQVIRLVKLRRMRLAGNVVCTGASRNVYKILVNNVTVKTAFR